MKPIEAVPVVRCKDCKFFSATTIGMPYACWRGSDKVWGETGEHAKHTMCTAIASPDFYCAHGERGEPDEKTMAELLLQGKPGKKTKLIDSNPVIEAIIDWALNEESVPIRQGALKAVEILKSAPEARSLLGKGEDE